MTAGYYRFWYIDPAGFSYALNDLVHSILQPNGKTGFGVLRARTASEQRPYRDGEVVTGRPYTGPRTFALALTIVHSTTALVLAYWRALARNQSPYKDPESLGAVLVETPDGLYRQIACWMIEAPDPEFRSPEACSALFTFWAPLPFFYDPTEQSEAAGLDNPGGVTFPADFVDPTGLEFATSDVDSHVSITNAGDVETWPTIRINGPGKDPAIENETTGKTMALTANGGITLDAGDYIDIAMDAATVSFHDNTDGSDTNIISTMSLSSVFWPLMRGENMLHCTMTNVTTGSIVVDWYNRYQSGL